MLLHYVTRRKLRFLLDATRSMCALRSHPPAMAEAEAVLAPAALEKSLCAWKGRWLAAAGFAISAGMATAEPEHQRGDDVEKGWHLLSLDQRRRAFFNYEKRIREFSPPEKIFEYFASLGDVRHGFVMTAADVMRSVVPVFPPMDSEILRAGSLPGEPQPIVPQQDSEFFKNFDLDKSGGFSFDEWLLFQSLLSIPAEDVAVAFSIIDSDGNGSIDANEFQSLLDSVQARAKVRPTATLRRSAADPTTGHAGLVTGFFGADRSKTLTLPQLQEFIDQLRVELMRLEFDFYDWKQRGAITGRDFAYSVVCWARLKHVDGYLDKVDALPPSLANADVTFDEFKQFRGCLRRLRAIEVALEFWRASTGHVTSKDFETVTARVLGKALPRHVLEVLHHLFGARGGELNTDYLVTVMERHHETGGCQEYPSSLSEIELNRCKDVFAKLGLSSNRILALELDQPLHPCSRSELAPMVSVSPSVKQRRDGYAVPLATPRMSLECHDATPNFPLEHSIGTEALPPHAASSTATTPVAPVQLEFDDISDDEKVDDGTSVQTANLYGNGMLHDVCGTGFAPPNEPVSSTCATPCCVGSQAPSDRDRDGEDDVRPQRLSDVARDICKKSTLDGNALTKLKSIMRRKRLDRIAKQRCRPAAENLLGLSHPPQMPPFRQSITTEASDFSETTCGDATVAAEAPARRPLAAHNVDKNNNTKERQNSSRPYLKRRSKALPVHNVLPDWSAVKPRVFSELEKQIVPVHPPRSVTARNPQRHAFSTPKGRNSAVTVQRKPSIATCPRDATINSIDQTPARGSTASGRGSPLHLHLHYNNIDAMLFASSPTYALAATPKANFFGPYDTGQGPIVEVNTPGGSRYYQLDSDGVIASTERHRQAPPLGGAGRDCNFEMCDAPNDAAHYTHCKYGVEDPLAHIVQQVDRLLRTVERAKQGAPGFVGYGR